MSHASIPEELLSAFVDGQLSGADKLRAEQLIAEDPRCAEFVNELRMQSKMLMELPRFELDDQFASRVLANAAKNQTRDMIQRFASSGNAFPMLHPGTIATAIGALAAMLLFLLFAFNQNWMGNGDPVATISSKPANPQANFSHSAKGNGNSVAPDEGTVSVGDYPRSETGAPVEAVASVAGDLDGTDTNDGSVAAGTLNDPESDLSDSDVGQIVNVIPSQNVDEVWYIDISGLQPLERLQLALKENKIQFQTGQNASPSQVSATGGSRVEAMYIYSTKSQIQGAMAQITSDADILAYSVPTTPVNEPVVAEVKPKDPAVEVNASAHPLAAISMAQQLPVELYLPKDLDHSTKMKSLAYGERDVAIEKPIPGIDDASETPAKNDADEVQVDENGKKPWYIEAEEERAREAALNGVSVSEVEQIQEPKKRFLLLIRFEGAMPSSGE